jgi:hypothetical protein
MTETEEAEFYKKFPTPEDREREWNRRYMLPNGKPDWDKIRENSVPIPREEFVRRMNARHEEINRSKTKEFPSQFD